LEVKHGILIGRPPRLKFYTPLRYPGGKGKLARFIKALIKTNRLLDSEYVEPFCGGAAVALELLFHEYVSRVHINDVSKPLHAFWESVLNHTDRLCRLVRDTPLTVREWDKQRRIFSTEQQADNLQLGFATFFLNRTNRSGVFNGGIIGGRAQKSQWKIDARFNRQELIFRIESIARLRDRIRLTRMDALHFLRTHVDRWGAKALIYLDPPYYEKGRQLYYDFYNRRDHEDIRDLLIGPFREKRWIVSYDDVQAIRALYGNQPKVVYSVGYSARRVYKGREVMFFSDTMQQTPLCGPLELIEN
jgi:DNA adenine methylase